VHVGILGGTGPAGRGLAARLASAGIEVTIGSRSTERAKETCAELARRWPDRQLALEGADNAGAAAAEVVVVATPWDAAAPTTASVAAHLVGKVVVSMANALARVGGEMQALVPPRGSVALGVQAAAPRALVSAALHHLPARELGDIATDLEADVLVCSDHPEATATTAALVSRVPGLRPLDAGSLSSAAAVEAFTAVLLNLNMRYKTRAAIRVTGVGTE
jgi:NADPH-dependent F420 reductase